MKHVTTEAADNESQRSEAGEPVPSTEPTGAPERPLPPPSSPWIAGTGGWGGYGGHRPLPPYGPAQYPYGPPRYWYAPTRRSEHVGPIFIVALIVILLVAVAAGAGIEYALHHSTITGQSPGSSASPASPAMTAKVDPAVVDITTVVPDGEAAGTGMVLTSSGLVLTNNHVIENATTVNAQVDGTGRSYSATVLGYSITGDVALLQLKGASGLKTVTTGNSSTLSVGASIVAIGNTGDAGGTPSAVTGTITALDQTITAGGDGELPETLPGLIEMNAAIVPGDSGGPLVDSSGQVIGMDTAAAVSGGGFGIESGTGQGYAIGIDNALAIANQIRARQASTTVHIGPRAVLGVEVSDGVSPSGAYVGAVESASPAASAGISAGDTIVAVNGTTISSASDLSNALVNRKPGNSVTVGWIDSSGASHSVSVTLTAGPPA